MRKKKKNTLPIDVRKVLRAAVEAALEEPAPPSIKPKKLSTGRVLIVGTGLVVAGGLLARGRDIVGSVGDRLDDLGVNLPGTDALSGDAEDAEVEDVVDDEPVDELADEQVEDEPEELEDLRKAKKKPAAAASARRPRRGRG